MEPDPTLLDEGPPTYGDGLPVLLAESDPTQPRLALVPSTAPAGKRAVPPPGVPRELLDPMRVHREILFTQVTAGLGLVTAAAVVATWGGAVPLRVLLLALCAAAVVIAGYRLRLLASTLGTAAWQRGMLERRLARYVSRGVADALAQGSPLAETRDVTVLFCDLRDFTSMCETKPPAEVVELLNTFFERACAIVEAHGGTVNKFLGDGMLALFGAPDDHDDPVQAAAQAAHEIMYAADELRTRGGIWRKLDIGIGLDCGDVVVGEVGASSRAEYTAIGTPVNRAARLQGLSREADRRIVLSEECARRLGPRANVVGMGSVKLKGIHAPVKVYAFRHS
ncbi:MAG TPA: adenylate/guanylate cyclase domain-containing protein [Kofleriaceae bacterium]|nr:adenylate/guanylate cyclase domain-containing protein [Kofleriaceae bacterium]